MTSRPTSRTRRIAALNDAFRQSIIDGTPTGETYLTAALAAHGEPFFKRASTAILCFDAFTDDIDPYRTHEWMRVTVDGIVVWAKIDYHDMANPGFAANDPSDATTTTRVLTLMLLEDI